MSGSGGIFVLVATYPDEVAAREGYQVVRDVHAAGLAGSCDAAAVIMDASSMVRENKDETATRHGAGRRCRGGGDRGHRPSGGPRRARGRRCGRCRQRAPGQGDVALRGETARRFHRPGPGRARHSRESKVEDAIRHAVTGAEKQTAQGPGVDPGDIGTAWQEPVREM
jgi:hypothetical protein